MLLPLFMFIANFLGLFGSAFSYLRVLSSSPHQECLQLVPISAYRPEYQSLVCAEALHSEGKFLGATGLFHWFSVFAFEIYLADWLTKKLFRRNLTSDIVCTAAILVLLTFTAFHPSGIRAAVQIFLRRFSAQKKFFWSPLQIAFFSGLFYLSLEPTSYQNHGLLMSWLAAICFAFWSTSHLLIQLMMTSLLLLPLSLGLFIPHPLLNLLFSFVSRPAVAILLTLSLLACVETRFLRLSDFVFDELFLMSKKLAQILSPFELSFHFSIAEIWLYLLLLSAVFLYLENKRLRGA